MTKELRERFEERYDHYNPIHDTGEGLPYWNPADWNDMITFIEEEIIEAERRVREEIKKVYEAYNCTCGEDLWQSARFENGEGNEMLKRIGTIIYGNDF